MQPILDTLQAAIASWPGVTTSPHRFGGLEFNLGTVEIGHVHRNGMVDIPFNRKIRDQLIREHKAEPHHLLDETGWISFYIRADADLQTAIWLLRLSYLFNASRRQGRAALGDGLNLESELAVLPMSEPLRAIFDGLRAR